MNERSDITGEGEDVEEVLQELWPLYLQKEQLRKEEEILAKKRETFYEQMEQLVSRSYQGEGRQSEQSVKTKLVLSFRELWQYVRRDDETRKTSLAVMHGIIERTDGFCLRQAEDWLWEAYKAIRVGQVAEAHKLEKSARLQACGLRVFDAERDPVNSRALFGVVREIENGDARLSMSIPEGRTDPKAPLWESFTVSVAELPEKYATEGAWVAWVERTYECDGIMVEKGRFEPASILPIPKIVRGSEAGLEYSRKFSHF